jgi:signal transduction histidine kinase
MTETITIEIPSHILESLQITPAQLKIELALRLYDEYNLSIRQAAEVAGITEGVDIYSRQLLDKNEHDRFYNFFSLLKHKTTTGISSQEWSASPGDELKQLLTTYEQLLTTKEMVKRVNSISQATEEICRELRLSTMNIAGFAEVLLEAGGTFSLEHQKEHLQSIGRNGVYLRRIIRTLEDIVKIESGDLRLQFDEVDLKKVVEETIAGALKIAKGTKIELECNIPDDLPKVWMDAYRISNVLYSFILNARFFDTAGILKIHIALMHDKGWITIVITDNGDGMPADYTETWTRYGYAMSLDASGIGRLERAVGEYLIKVHNGEINIEYNEGNGTCITIKLPIRPSKVSEQKVAAYRCSTVVK